MYSLLTGVGVHGLGVVVQEEGRDTPLLVNLLGLVGSLSKSTSDHTRNLGVGLVGNYLKAETQHNVSPRRNRNGTDKQ